MWWEFLQEKSLQLCKRAIFLAIFWLQEMVHNQQHMKLEAWDIRIFFGGVDKMVGSCESQWYWRERHTLDVSMCISVSTLQLWIYRLYIYMYIHIHVLYIIIYIYIWRKWSLYLQETWHECHVRFEAFCNDIDGSGQSAKFAALCRGEVLFFVAQWSRW